MSLCQSRSPETEIECSLPDDRHYHSSGHESKYIDGARTEWATTPEEQRRWLEKESTDGR